MFSDWFYVEVVVESGGTSPLEPDYEERAIYVVEGEVAIAGGSFEAPRLLIFRPGDRITSAGKEACAPHVSRRLSFAGTMLHLVEFRLLTPRKNRTGEARLEVRPVRSGPRRNRVHSSPGELAWDKTRPN
jgi:hypothetical protein